MTLGGVMSRDGTNCVWCGRSYWRRDLTVEHLLPRTRGGRGLAENVTVACRRCNRQRGAKPVVAYVRERLNSGEQPDLTRLRKSLERLVGSDSPAHAGYARRQLVLLGRIASRSGEHRRLPGEPGGVELG